MPELTPILIAGLTGFGFAFAVSIPVGPVNLSIMNEGAQRGFKYAALIGVGASLMETIYCSLAFTGFSSFFQLEYVKAGMEVFSFAFLMFLGLKFLLASSVPTAGRVEKHIQGKLHPRSPFMNGLVMVMANPGVLLWWIVITVNFMSRGWVQPRLPDKGACVLGVALGTGAWFMGLAFAASLGHRKFSEKTLLRMERGSGISLLILALVHGCYIAIQMVKHKHRL